MTSEQSSPAVEPGPLSVPSGIPIACTPMVFSKEERSAHLELSVDVIIRWPKQRRELSDGFLFEYEGNEERFLTLARWACSEHRCCPWAGYSVEMGPFSSDESGTMQVRVRGTEEGKAFLKTCYEYLEQLQGAEPPDSIFHSKQKLTHESVLEEIRMNR